MNMKGLKARLRTIGATEQQIEDLDEADDIKAAAIELVLHIAATTAGLGPGAGAASPGSDVTAGPEPEPEHDGASPDAGSDALALIGTRCTDFDEFDSDMLGPVRGLFDDEENPRVSIDKAVRGECSVLL